MVKIISIAALWLTVSLAHADEIPGACRTDDTKFNSEEGGCLHFSTGTSWSMAPSAKRDYQKAYDYCEGLNEGGFDDWKLPNSKQLQAVAQQRGALDHFQFRMTDFFWAITPGSGSDAWTVELATGDKDQAEKTAASGRVVCVRLPLDVDEDGVPDSSDRCNRTPVASRTAVETTGDRKGCAQADVAFSAARARRLAALGCKVESEYFRTGDFGCLHLRTGSEWSGISERKQQRKHAHRYCDELMEGVTHAINGWRLPNYHELERIAGDGLAPRHFKFDTNQSFWSSTLTSRQGTFFSYRPNGNVPYEEKPQVIVNLMTGALAGISTQEQVRAGNVNDRSYHEPLVPINETYELNIVCVMTVTVTGR